jgi:hypothetical protein
MRTEIYSWRVSREMKSELEREARRRKLSLSAVLDLAASEWLKNSAAGADPEEEQERIRRSAAESIGSLAGPGGTRSATVREAVRERLRKHYGR